MPPSMPIRFVRKIGGILQDAWNRVQLEDVSSTPISASNPLHTAAKQVDSSGVVYGVKQIDGKMRVASTPYGYDVVEGNIPNHDLVVINASVIAATNAWADMWGGSPAAPNVPLLAAAVAMEIVGGAQDTAAGTGISQVEIHYLDANGDLQETTITLTGAVAVALPENVLHINSAHCVAAGAGATAPFAASANIDIRGAGGGTVYARIPIGTTATPRMAFRIPRSTVGYWADLLAFVLALSNNSDAQLQIVANLDLSSYTVLPIGMWEVLWTVGGGSTGANVSHQLGFPFKFPAGTIVKCRVRRVSGAGNADGFITGIGWMEPA